LTDRAACITEADAAGIFLLGIDATPNSQMREPKP
jgi:hypothetical protein